MVRQGFSIEKSPRLWLNEWEEPALEGMEGEHGRTLKVEELNIHEEVLESQFDGWGRDIWEQIKGIDRSPVGPGKEPELGSKVNWKWVVYSFISS